MKLFTYLQFGGNCRQAMEFYQHCLGGTLTFQTLGNSPGGKKMPAHLKNYILNATLRNKEWTLVATDIGAGETLQQGNNITLMLAFSNEKQLQQCVRKLSAGGTTGELPVRDIRTQTVHQVLDQFGNYWLLYCP